MKIFISWSGHRSKAVAEILSDWIKCVLQASDPWISTRDIDRGALWYTEISEKLKDISVGIICLTSENKNNPWILFETGALAKGLKSSRVCTFLIDLQPQDIKDPLAQFNHTLPERDSVWSLIRTVNDCLNEKSLELNVLEKVFDTYWPQFISEFDKCLLENPLEEEIVPRSEQDILSEILKHTRNLSNRVYNLEKNTKLYKDENMKEVSSSQKSIYKLISDMKKIGIPSSEIRNKLSELGFEENDVEYFNSKIPFIISNEFNTTENQ